MAAASTPDPGSTIEAPTPRDMRSDLVRAALVVLRRDGPAGLTVRSITDEAGCSTTGIYTHFGGKHGLVEAVFLDGFESFDAATGPSLDAGDIAAAGRAYRQWALANHTQYMVMFGRAVPDYVPSERALERALESFARLARSVHEVEHAADAAERAYHLFATIHGYVMLEMSGMGAATAGEAEALFERAIHALGATP